MLHFIRSRKSLLFGFAGLVGGMVGAAIGFSVFMATNNNGNQLIGQMVSVAAWMGTISIFLTLGLFVAGEYYNRRPPFAAKVIVMAVLLGLLGGGLAGCIAQLVFSIPISGAFLKNVVFRSICWGVAGAMLGMACSRVVPNLGWKRGSIGGFIGGLVGGVGFIIVATMCGSGEGGLFAGHIFGMAVLGLALGLSIVTVEALMREAALQIVWAPNEVTTVSLGAKMVTIGGGDDTVYIHNLPPRSAGVRLENGQLSFIDLRTNQSQPLRNGSRLKIGKVELVIVAAS